VGFLHISETASVISVLDMVIHQPARETPIYCPDPNGFGNFLPVGHVGSIDETRVEITTNRPLDECYLGGCHKMMLMPAHRSYGVSGNFYVSIYSTRGIEDRIGHIYELVTKDDLVLTKWDH
jgi:hypothetical protein